MHLFMRLNLHTDHALRLLMELARADGWLSADAVAEIHGISRNHLTKIAARLAELGHVVTRRGRNGGIALASPPDQINVGAVVRALESLDGFVECFDPRSNTCILAGRCGLQGILGTALQDFLRRLDQYSLADLIRGPIRVSAAGNP